MSASYGTKAVRAQRVTTMAVAAVTQALADEATLPAHEATDALARTISALADPPRNEGVDDDEVLQLELLRALERHGDGLVPFDAAAGSAVGDVVVATDRTVWLVTAVDEKGAVTGVAGWAPKTKKQRRGVLRWRQSTARRAWADKGQTPAPAYTDVDKALAHLSRLWGEEWVAGRELATAAGWFLQVLEAPGLKLRAAGLNDYGGAADVLDFCTKRGGVGQVAASSALTPGDLVLPDAKTGWAVVTRSAAGRVDLLGAPKRKGLLGEPVGSAQFLRSVPPPVGAAWWRPQKAT